MGVHPFVFIDLVDTTDGRAGGIPYANGSPSRFVSLTFQHLSLLADHYLAYKALFQTRTLDDPAS
jgi:hypothetical protein